MSESNPIRWPRNKAEYYELKKDPIALEEYRRKSKEYRVNWIKAHPEEVKERARKKALKRIADRERLKSEDPDGFIRRLNRTRDLRRKWKDAHPEEYLLKKEKRRKLYNTWRTENPEEFNAAWKRWKNAGLVKTYGITIEDYDRMLSEQKGVCAVCGGTNSDGRDLSVDHDHTRNTIRGLLCQNCNRAIGLLKDTVEIVQKAADYIRKYRGTK